MTWIDQPNAWNGKRGRELVKFLARTYRSTAEVQKLLDDFDARIGVPLDAPTIETMWHQVARKLHTGRQFRGFLDLVADDTPGLTTELVEWSADDPANGAGNPSDAYQVRLVGPGKRPMIDRGRFRDKLRRFLNEGDSEPVLLIRGPERSGKSYSFELMKHVVGGLDDPRLILIDFSYAASGNNAAALMGMICSRLGVRDVTGRTRRTTVTRFAAELVDDLVGVYRFDDTITRILVIDGLNRADLEPDVYNLVVRLASEVVNVQLPRTRLVLTGYTGIFDRQLNYSILSEDVRAITETDVWLYFKDLGTDLGKDLPRAELDSLVSKAMRGDAGLEALADRVHGLALSLVGTQ